MNMMNDLHFLRPNFLYVLIPITLLVFLFYRSKRRSNIWNKICSSDLMPHILARKATNSCVPSILIFLTLFLLTVALAGPTWQQISLPLSKQQSGLVIVLDLSTSMNAEDIKPSRIQRAIYKISDILDKREEGQTALIVFSENPYTVTPLTDDVSTIKAMLPALDTKIMPTAGHEINLAITKATDLLRQAGITNGSILLVTSELSNEDMNKSIAAATAEHAKVFVLGVGTEGAAPIPKAEGGFYKDSKGTLIMSMLSTQNLNHLAQSTHGKYTTITADDRDINDLMNKMSSLNASSALTQSDQQQSKWLDQGYLLVVLALPFFCLLFRRGVLVIVLFALPQVLQAFTYNDLWKTSDQQAETCFHQQDYEQAKELFKNKDWQASTHYQLGDYESAAKLFEDNQTVEGLFNYGTACAKMGDLDEALIAYEKVLALQADHEDALYNKKQIEEYQKQSSENDQNDKKKDKSKNDQQKDKKDKDKNSGKDKDKEENKDAKDQPSDDQDEGQSSDDEENEHEGDSDQKRNQDKQDQGKQDKEQPADEKDDENKLDDEQVKDLCDQYRDQMNKEMQDEIDKKAEEENNAKEEKEQKAANLQPEDKDEQPEDEQQRIDECWLQRINDDPGGLLRRKFQLQYQQQHKASVRQ